MELHLKIIGWVLIALALIHIGFPKRFNWEAELKPLSLINRQMMQVHTFFIAVVVFLNGVLCLSSAHDLVTTPLGKNICLGIAVFWALRLVFQFFVYSPELWKGKRFETTMHIVFSFLWLYLTVVFFVIYLS